MTVRHGLARRMYLVALLCTTLAFAGAWAEEPAPLRAMLDAPLLFVKRHSYQGIHIYDTYYKWGPGGGIYVLENPWDPPELHRIRPIIDADTPETLGGGVYSDPDLSYDGKRLLFCHKPEQDGSTSIYEIGVDGTGLRRLTDPCACLKSEGVHPAQHDVSPAYMPDGRIVFTSTRPNGLVPCANSGADILHVMNRDGSNVRRLSVNNVNEFDPCVLPDGRILHGRWEYVDKNALTIQSLWTIFPDGTNETALFANNMARPEALLDARPVPGAPHLIATVFTPHNAPPRGCLAMVDTRLGKNGIAPITNFENKDDPAFDRGDSCEPWPLSEDVILFSGRPQGFERNVIELIHRDGRRELVLQDPDICCHSPMLLKPRPEPDTLTETAAPDATCGQFYVQDIYRGLAGVERGEVKWLRIIEETSRTSASPGGDYNQTFLISAALAFSAKNFLGIVPVESDGSAHFEVPAGRALFLQALDGDGRLIQSMRTFVQAAPGVTRSCIGCHEPKFDAPSNQGIRQAHRKEPVRPVPESWGTGYLDYPSMVQPVLNRHCVSCHGGERGFAAGLDLTGGWTEHFSNSYENLVSRRESQLTATLIAGIDCMNGTALWSSPLFPPRGHGSGAAPLAGVLVSGHNGRIPDLTRRERDLLLAWIDTNGVYHGTWDYTEHGCRLKAWGEVRDALVGEMRAAGCMRCHERDGRAQFEGDWFNLERPELSRILRAPLAKGSGLGLGLCQDKMIDPRRQRIRLLVGGTYAHGILPIETFIEQGAQPPRDDSVALPVAAIASAEDPHYEAMLAIIRQGRRDALATPRVDMPGAVVIAGHARHFIPPPLPDPLPSLQAEVDEESAVHLTWECSARTIGLVSRLYRGTKPDFAPAAETLLAETRGFEHLDIAPSQGEQHYALVMRSGIEETAPVRVTVNVPSPPAPSEPAALRATPVLGGVDLAWEERAERPLRYHVYRAAEGARDFERITREPATKLRFVDTTGTPEVDYAYTVRAVSRRGAESAGAPAVIAAALPEVREPVFVAAFAADVHADLLEGGPVQGVVLGVPRIDLGALDLREGGHVAYEHSPAFDLSHRISVECWVKFARDTEMPVVMSCGQWAGPGWFLQRIGGGWRWYVGSVICDGGRPKPGEWTHLAATYDGEMARLFQDGQLVAEKAGTANQTPWTGALHVGQYSAGPGPQYQVNGWISRVRVYNCALNEDDLRARSQNPEVRSQKSGVS